MESHLIDFVDPKPVTIKVIGVGGGGCNAVRAMSQAGFPEVTFILANTDFPSSRTTANPVVIQLGEKLTRGLGAGAGAEPGTGRKAAEESLPLIIEHIRDAEMLFITAGMGGGTGTGAAPLIARTAKELGILTIGVVTMPFAFEGKKRREQTERGFLELRKYIDSHIVIANDRLATVTRGLPIGEAFEPANKILCDAVKSLVELIRTTGLINIDFADIKNVLSHRGRVLMGSGSARGSKRAEKALAGAIDSPLLKGYALDGARGLLVNIAGSSTLTMEEFDRIIDLLHQKIDDDAEIFAGLVIDEDLHDTIRVTVIASGLQL